MYVFTFNEAIIHEKPLFFVQSKTKKIIYSGIKAVWSSSLKIPSLLIEVYLTEALLQKQFHLTSLLFFLIKIIYVRLRKSDF